MTRAVSQELPGKGVPGSGGRRRRPKVQKGPDDDRTQKKGRQFKTACGLGSVCTGPQCAVGPAGFLSETCVTSKN